MKKLEISEICIIFATAYDNSTSKISKNRLHFSLSVKVARFLLFLQRKQLEKGGNTMKNNAIS